MARAGPRPRPEPTLPDGTDGYGTGDLRDLERGLLRLDGASFAAVARTAAEYELGCHDTTPADIPGYRPQDNDRALRARYLTDEGFLDARVRPTTLDAALPALPNGLRTQPGNPTALPVGGYLLDTPTGVFRARARWRPPAPGPPRSSKPSTPTCPSCRSWPRPAPR